jgi:hypothetical protein
MRMGKLTGIAVFLLAIGLAACATLPPAKPVHDLKSIAGAWEGMAARAEGVATYTMTIKADGSWEATARGGTFEGSMRLEDGKIHSQSKTTGIKYMFTLHEGEGQRVLKGSSYDGSVTIELRPVR